MASGLDPNRVKTVEFFYGFGAKYFFEIAGRW